MDTMPTTMHDGAGLIRALHDPACYDHPAGPVRVVETHISWVLLTGEFAYKIKKPLDLGFLDFSSLDKRLHACCDEVQLNRRLAPDIYLDVVPITGSPAAPRINGSGETFEYAVKMRQFPAEPLPPPSPASICKAARAPAKPVPGAARMPCGGRWRRISRRSRRASMRRPTAGGSTPCSAGARPSTPASPR